MIILTRCVPGSLPVTESFVQYAAAGGIAILTLNRPESRNAIA
jgi:enoyl-CoA hydratase/carnithine racemase